METCTSIIKSKAFRWAIGIIVVIAAAFFIFQAGIFVGYHKATFSYRWGEQYHRNFGGPRGGFIGMFDPGFANPHGSFGTIIKIDPPTFLIADPNEAEKTIMVASSTILRRFHDTITLSDLRAEDRIVVIGEPNDKGQIEARLIRVLPSAPSSFFPITPTK